MLAGNENFEEYDLLELNGCGLENDGLPLLDFQKEINPGFGCYARELGAIESPTFAVEVDETDDLGDGTVRTPMMEFGIDDYNYVKRTGTPFPGMFALGDNGDLYQYTQDFDGTLGGIRSWFKRVRRRAKKRVKKIKKRFKRVGKRFKKILTKTRFGRALVKIGGKVYKAGMKVVKPIIRKVGKKWLKKLAPIAMAIPGIGWAAGAAMTVAGAARPILKKYGGTVKKIKNISRKTGKIYDTYRIKSKKPKRLLSALRREANKYKRLPQSYQQRLISSLKNINPNSQRGRYLLPTQNASIASRGAAAKLSMLAQKDNALAYARNRANSVAQRNAAANHARHLAAANRSQNAQVKRIERNQKINMLKNQLRMLGVRV